MYLYNLTTSILTLPLGNIRIQIKPRSKSNSINLTPKFVVQILNLIKLYGTDIIVSLNNTDVATLESNGLGLPAENCISREEAEERLKKVIEAYNATHKPVEPEETKEVIRDDLGAGIPAQAPEDLSQSELPPITIIKGKQ